MYTVWQKAVSFAAQAHAGQKRPDERTPYMAHPARVALAVGTLFHCHDASIIAVALLHDVLEKTSVSHDEVAHLFSSLVASRVQDLTKNPGEEEDAYLTRLRECDWQTRLVKLADMFDNLDEGKGGLEERIEKAVKVLELAFGHEEPIVLARKHLTEAIHIAQLKLELLEPSAT